jgi:lipopolysaccharide export system protein LptC
MSEAAISKRTARQNWAAPGSSHDSLIRVLRVVLPAAIGMLTAFLAVAPLTTGKDLSFVLDKDKVAVAKERLRVTAANYRGQDSKGQAFILHAGSAVQHSSTDPIVRLSTLTARLALPEGPSVLAANQGRYDMDNEKMAIDGPVLFRSADGYRLLTRDVDVDMKTRKLASRGPAQGSMPIGTFSGDRMTADLTQRIVTLEGRGRLHIVQGAAKGK